MQLGAVPFLIQNLDNPESGAAVPALERAARDPNPMLEAVAQQALVEVRGRR